MDRCGCSLAIRDGIDEVARAKGDIATGPNPRITRTQVGIDSDTTEARAVQFELTEELDVRGLPDREDDRVGGHHGLRSFGKDWREAPVSIEHGNDFHRF